MVKRILKRLSFYLQLFTGVHELRKGTAIFQAREYERLKDAI